MYTPQHLEKWATPPSYFGVQPTDYYVVAGTHRDADSVTRENWISIAGALCDLLKIDCIDHDNPGDLLDNVPDDESDDRPNVCVTRANHWAVGWCETMLVHESAEKTLMLCDSIHKALADYPVVDEEKLSEIEYQDEVDYWDNCLIYQDFGGAIEEKYGIELDVYDSDKLHSLFYDLCGKIGRYPEHTGHEVIYPEWDMLLDSASVFCIRRLGEYVRAE